MISPSDELLADGGWTLVEDTTEIVFQLPTAQVRGHTRVYEDQDLADEIETTLDGRGIGRFVFATNLSFTPPLAPGIGTAMIRPTVVAEARKSFAEMLRERGITNVHRGRRERTRTHTRDRIRLQEYQGSVALDIENEGVTVPVTGWFGVWTTTAEFRIAGGVYPDSISSLSDIPGIDTDSRTPNEYRRELFELIRSVG